MCCNKGLEINDERMNINRFYSIPKVSTEPSKFGFRRIHSYNAYAVSIIVAVYGLLMMSLLGSCSENFQVDSQFSDPKDAIIRFQINTDTPKDATTRSVNEDKINDLHVLVYNSAGELTGKSYTTFSSTTYTVSVLTRSGTGCNIYAIANTGSPTLFDGTVVSTETKLKAMTTNLATWNTFNNTSGTVYLPMSGSVTTNISAGTTSLQGGITVKRLMARITLNVGISSGSGVTISGYRIYGIPGRSYYVSRPLSTEDQTTDSQTARAGDASLPANPANWMNSGLVSLSDATSFSTDFYTYENRAGVNSAITAQNQKIKANVPATPADSAAYVMIYGKASGYSNLSWKIYLGANNTSNFNLKRNCKYTYNITLKPNDSDTRIIYKKSGIVWAGSNIYWNGSKLTFDSAPVDPTNPTTQELSNQRKQGVFFKWGALVGVSSNASSYDGAAPIYVPSYNSTIPTSSSWLVQNGSQMGWNAIPYFTDNLTVVGQTSTFLNDAAQNTDANYASLKGDICKYLSRTGAVSGKWRMPTTHEYNPNGVGDRVFVAWTDNTAPWSMLGTFGAESGNAQGTSLFSSGCTYLLGNSRSNFSSSGYRDYPNGLLSRTGFTGEYWTSSAYSGTEYSYYFHFSDTLSPSFYNPRNYGFVIRCIQE